MNSRIAGAVLLSLFVLIQLGAQIDFAYGQASKSSIASPRAAEPRQLPSFSGTGAEGEADKTVSQAWRKEQFDIILNGATYRGVSSNWRCFAVARLVALVATVPTIILVALSILYWRARKNPSRLKAVLLWAAAAAVLLVSAAVGDVIVGAQEEARRSEAAGCVAQVAKALGQYAQLNQGWFPAASDWPDALIQQGLLDRDTLSLPVPFGQGKANQASEHDITYSPFAGPLTQNDDRIIAWQSRACHVGPDEDASGREDCRYVVFSSTRSVRLVTEPQFRSLLERSILTSLSAPGDQ